MPPILPPPKANRPILSRPAHAPANDDRRADIPHAHGEAAPARLQEEGDDAYQADRAFHAMLARATGGISPAALLLAYTDWLSHLAAAPQRQMEMSQEAVLGASRFLEAALHYFSPDQGPWSLIKPQAQDRRFDGTEWESPPFNLLAQAFLLGQQWWHNASTGVRGVAKSHEAVVEFSVRQMLDVLAPSNFAATNPEVLQKAFQSGGANFVSGWQNWCSDWMQLLSGGKRLRRRQRFRRRQKRCDLARQGRASATS